MLPEKKLKEAGINQYGFLSPADIVFSDEIRKICEGNSCRSYAKTWACPPAVGTVEHCRQRCLQYTNAMVFSAVYPINDSFDYEGMVWGHGAFKKLCDKLYSLVKEEYASFLLLSNEGCTRCKTCTYPDAACRMPQRLFPSLEGYGINVMQLAGTAGISYHSGKNTVTYFGMVLY